MELEAPEIEVVETTRVSCHGQGGWYQIPLDKGWVECGYCDKRFVLAGFESKMAEET